MRLLPRHHQLVRFGSLVVLGASLTYVGSRLQVRKDVTEEGLSKLTEGTEALIENISAERPVTIHAFISKDVPREYVTVRSRLLNILHEMEASGGEGLTVRVVEPEAHSLEAEEAMENYGIMPRQVAEVSGGRVRALDVFMGLAFVSGPREEVVPFMDRGLSVEYEVARALEVVTQDKKKVVGIVNTDAQIMGSFDMQTRSQRPAWRIVGELRKQYEVRSLAAKSAIPDDIDVLFVPQLSSLEQDELDNVKAYVDAGRPALLTADPMPLDVRLAPREPKLPPPGQQGGMFGQPPMGGPKGDYKGFLNHVGVKWDDQAVAFDTHNPNPRFDHLPPHILFVGERPDGTNPFADGPDIVGGFSQVVVLFGGVLEPNSGYEDKFTPLLVTGRTSSGINKFDDLVDRHPFFGLQMRPVRTPGPATPSTHVMAARVTGSNGEEGVKDRNLIVVADLDLFGDTFFQMHEQGGDLDADGLLDVRFDNVPFLLNAVDTLAGDERFIQLRKRQPEFRRLTMVDELTEEAREKRQKSMEEANSRADQELEEAQKALDGAVAAVRERTDLDETTKRIMVESARQAEERRLQVKTEKIEREKQKAITRTETEHRRAVDEIQNRIRLFALLLPPVPALLLGAVIFGRKRRRERESIPNARRTVANRKNSKGDVA